jgi:2-octaprenyl-6-methoxyphenol hydroxylase
LLRLARDIGMGAVNRIAPLRTFLMEDAGAATGDMPKLLRGELV